MGISRIRAIGLGVTAHEDNCWGIAKPVKRKKNCPGCDIHLTASASDGWFGGLINPAHYDIVIEETEGEQPKIFGSASAYPSLEIYMYDAAGSHLVYSYDASSKNVTNITDTMHLNDGK